MHIEVCVDHYRDNRLAVKLQIDLELITVVFQQLREANVWLVNVLVVVVLLKHSEHLRERALGMKIRPTR